MNKIVIRDLTMADRVDPIKNLVEREGSYHLSILNRLEGSNFNTATAAEYTNAYDSIASLVFNNFEFGSSIEASIHCFNTGLFEGFNCVFPCNCD